MQSYHTNIVYRPSRCSCSRLKWDSDNAGVARCTLHRSMTETTKGKCENFDRRAPRSSEAGRVTQHFHLDLALAQDRKPDTFHHLTSSQSLNNTWCVLYDSRLHLCAPFGGITVLSRSKSHHLLFLGKCLTRPLSPHLFASLP